MEPVSAPSGAPPRTPTKKGLTIDGPTSLDLDDAIRLDPDGDGWRVTVFIADVAREVPRDSRFDVDRPVEGTEDEEGGPRVRQGAYSRIETRYWAGGNTPMLPRILSEDRLSLHEGRRRHVLSIEIPLASDLSPRDLPILSLVEFRSRARLSYHEVPAILTDEGHPLHEKLVRMARLAEGLLVRRQAGGALVVYDLNRGWISDEEGNVHAVERPEEAIGNVVVQELMILANAEVARWCAERELPVLFRNHTAKAHAPPHATFQAQFAVAMGQPLAMIADARTRLNHLLNRATYDATLIGHFGLALPAYLHVTSPIRRYADLVNHRQIRAVLLGAPLPYVRDEIAELGTYLTTELWRRADARSAAEQARAHDRAATDLDRGRFAHLEPRELDRVVRLATQERTPHPALCEALLACIGDGSASLRTRTFVLFTAPRSEGWRPVHEAIIAALGSAPHDAAGIVNLAVQLGFLTPVAWTEEADGPDHARRFFARGTATCAGTAIETGTIEGVSKRTAMQRAMVRLLALAVGSDSGVLPEPILAPAAPSTVAKSKPTVPVENDNPVAALQEFCQARGEPLPDYQFGPLEGPPHMPTIRCACALGAGRVEATGANKKEAKRLAAAHTIARLRQGGHHGAG